MKATIDSTGTLTIVPESETEAYALRCYGKKFNSDTPPALRLCWEEIHSPGGCRRPAKGSSKPSQFWPFDKDETARIQQGQPPLTKSQLDLIKGSGMKTDVDTSDVADAARFRWILEGNGYYMEETGLCGISPCSEEEKNLARLKIDKEMKADHSQAM